MTDPVPAIANPLTELRQRLEAATGADPAIDHALAHALGEGDAASDYTASPEACTRLLARHLPGWHRHVGWDASGLFPYASLSLGSEHASATAPTLPLAILRALLKALSGERDTPPVAPDRPAWQR